MKMSSINTITTLQSLEIATASAFSSSVINHPFQVIRARFQARMSLPTAERAAFPVFPPNSRTLVKGFSSTFCALLSSTATQMYFKHLLCSHGNLQFCSPVVAGTVAAILMTPLEAYIIHNIKPPKSAALRPSGSFVIDSYRFYRQYGLLRLYFGFKMTAARSTVVGTGFSLAIPTMTHYLEESFDLSSSLAVSVSGITVGTIFAAISQPFETIRIEQQFSADEAKPLNIRRAISALYKQNGVAGLFKGGSYRIPRTAPGICIIGLVSQQLEKYFLSTNGVLLE